MDIFNLWNKKHHNQTEKDLKELAVLIDKLITELSLYASSITLKGKFKFNNYPTLNKRFEKLLEAYIDKMESYIQESTVKHWNYAQTKNDTFFKEKKPVKFKPSKRKISNRIWKQSRRLRTELEMALDLAIQDGTSANKLASELKKYVKNPDELFRVYRDKHGVVTLKGKQGVYKSAYKNAQRLARTEINMAYRRSDIERWNTLTFVTGYEIHLSQNYHNCDICKELKGNYPKNFVWTGWHPNCYSEDTEVLTNNGWKYFKDLHKEDKIFSLNPDTKNVEYVDYVNYFSYRKKGKMIRYHNRSLDMLVTPDHKMVYLNKSDGKTIMTNKTAENFTVSTGGFYRSSEYENKDIEFIKIGKHQIKFELFAEFMAYYLSDGSISWTRNNQFSIAQSKEKSTSTYEKINELLNKLPFKFTALEDRFYLRDKEMYNYLKQFGKSEDKYIPSEIKNASKNQIKIFLDSFIICDGHERPNRSFIGSRGSKFISNKTERMFFTSSNQVASDLGELLVKIGSRPSYSIQKVKGVAVKHRNGTYIGNKDLYRIRECYSKTATSFKREEIDYDGFVYDIELEKNHILYVRRNGKCLWGSNCRCYMTPLLRTKIIEDTPQNFKKWMLKNTDKISRAKTKPFFISDNPKYF